MMREFLFRPQYLLLGKQSCQRRWEMAKELQEPIS